MFYIISLPEVTVQYRERSLQRDITRVWSNMYLRSINRKKGVMKKYPPDLLISERTLEQNSRGKYPPGTPEKGVKIQEMVIHRVFPISLNAEFRR
jgi:hypothetical protein